MAYRSCYPEVGDLDLAGLVDQDVARLHVAVYHAPAMGEVERVRDVSAYRGGPLRRKRALADESGKRLAVDVLHDDEVRVLALAPVVDRNDVGVGEVCCCLGFPTEPLDERGVRGELGEEHLDRDGPVKQQVLRQVNLGHAAARDVAHQLVAVAEDFRRCHVRHSLGLVGLPVASRPRDCPAHGVSRSPVGGRPE